MSRTPAEWRAQALDECDEVTAGIVDLFTMLEQGAGMRTVAGQINDIRRGLTAINNAMRRDGRWPGYAPTDQPRNAPWLHTAQPTQEEAPGE